MRLLVSSKAVAVAVAVMLIFSTSRNWSQERHITNDELKMTFESGNVDQIIESLNAVKRMNYQGSILELLRAIWDNAEGVSANFPEHVNQLPIIRMEVANVLLQAERNGLIEFDTAEARAESLVHIHSQDIALLGVTISNLAIIDNDEDVELLKSIAARRNQSTFRRVVLGLATMCSERASDALDDLTPTALSMGELEFLNERRQSMSEIRHILCDK